MRKFIWAFCLSLSFFAVSPMVTHPAWAEVQAYQDNAFDKMGDWFATLGKSGDEKDSILAQRKADRISRHAEKQAQKISDEAQKTAEDIQKKLEF
ncbi:MAG TPA: hypothetical protein VD913_03940 [bacterium]|nr:hypothetical protein [bacterium]